MKTTTKTAEFFASATEEPWRRAEGQAIGGFVVGHLAKMNGNPNNAFIVGVRNSPAGIQVMLDFMTAQPCDGPEGATSRRFEVSWRAISSTWLAGPTVQPYKRPSLPVVHEFGSAPSVVPAGYRIEAELVGDPEELKWKYRSRYVILVKGPAVAGTPGHCSLAVFGWKPSFSPWRHGGWYNNEVRYHCGGTGCVSNNYHDRLWRIACDDRRLNLDEPGDFTYPSRDAAARAELELAHALKTYF